MVWWAIIGGFLFYLAAFIHREMQHYRTRQAILQAYHELQQASLFLTQQIQTTREELLALKSVLASKGVVSDEERAEAIARIGRRIELAADKQKELLHDTESPDAIDPARLVVQKGNESVH